MSFEDPEGTIWLTRYPYRGARVLYVECREMNFTVTAKPTEYRLSYGLGLARDSEGNCGLGPAHWLKATLCRWCRQSRRQLLVDTLALAEDRQDSCEFKCAIPRLAMYGCR